MVGLALLLSRFEDVSVLDEQWLELVDAARCNEHEVEDRHHAELKIVGTIAELPECKASEETVGHVDSDFVPDVVGVAPQCDESTFRDQNYLVLDRRREVCSVFAIDRRCVSILSLIEVDLVEFIHHVLVLR